jgi:hypothetical protein
LLLSACQGHRGSSAGAATKTSRTDQGTTVKTSSDEGGEKSRVIIKKFDITGITEDEASGVTSKFCVEVSKSTKIELICAGDIKHLFQHQEDLIKFGACNQEDCLAKMGEKLKADLFIQGAINKVGETFVVNVTLREGATGKIKTRLSQEVTSGKVEDLLGAAESLAEKVALEF